MADRDERNIERMMDSTDRDVGDWTVEETYWRTNWQSRPYVVADRGFEFYRPGYRYGVESAQRFRGREWRDVEDELRTGWDRYEHRAQATWENMKDAVHDAWDRLKAKF